MTSNLPLFSENTGAVTPQDTTLDITCPPWKVLVVDDEPSVHHVTSIALKRFRFQERPLELIHAHSAKESRDILHQHNDIAIILLDVVMEEDTAGLQLVRYARETLGNAFVRVILRTGQPGVAPESEVVELYDINDYLDKSELTAQKLSSAIFTGLRSYRDLSRIEQNRQDLKQVLDATSSLAHANNFDDFISGLLDQFNSVISSAKNSHQTENISGFVSCCNHFASHGGSQQKIVYGCGSFASKMNQAIVDSVSGRTFQRIVQSIESRCSQFFDDESIFIFNSTQDEPGMIYLAKNYAHHEHSQDLIELFSTNVSVAYENLSLYKEIEDTQKEMIFTLGTIAEFRSNETAEHVIRLAEYSELLALKAGLSEDEAKLIKLASPLHDIGKIATPDHILNKPGALTKEEMVIMCQHTTVGYEMLKHSKRTILQAAATIAYEHQEKWNGTGYPRKLSGADIHIYGRIVAIADVFDALGSDRCYKKAWHLPDILDYFHEQREEHFDPLLVDLFIKHMDEFLGIRDSNNFSQ